MNPRAYVRYGDLIDRADAVPGRKYLRKKSDTRNIAICLKGLTTICC